MLPLAVNELGSHLGATATATATAGAIARMVGVANTYGSGETAVAALLSIVKVLRLDPASVFKG